MLGQSRSTSNLRSGERGIVLLMALGILALLSILVAAFAALMSLEYKAVTNARESVRARLIARSGLERAKFELRRAAQTTNYPLPWIQFDGGLGTAALPVPIETEKQPSFPMALNPVPTLLTQVGSPFPYPSGMMGATYYKDTDNPAMGGDYYVLQVTDNNSLIDINDMYNPHLQKMLNNLVQALMDANVISDPNGNTVGQRILAARPPAGFRRVEELQGVLSTTSMGTGQPAEFDAVAPFLTCVAYVDQKVVQAGEQAGNVQATLTPQPRAPINVNLAPWPVIVAALTDVGYGGLPGNPAAKVTINQAEQLATQIVTYRKSPWIDASPNAAPPPGPNMAGNPASPRFGFQKWSEFAKFLTSTAPQNIFGILNSDPSLAAAVLANANPNTDLNKFVPDLCMMRLVDKFDLTLGTTELCFAPGGIFTIASLGVVLDRIPQTLNGQTYAATIVAEAKVRSTVKVFDRYVDTTQRDFETDRMDPTSPAPSPYFALRDVTTLPEFRNINDGPQAAAPATVDPFVGNPNAESAGARASLADGQVSYNVITQEPLSNEGAYAGYIGRDLNGVNIFDAGGNPNGVVLKQVGPATGTVPYEAPGVGPAGTYVCPPAPDFVGATNLSDLTPFGVLLGRPLNNGRYLQYPQTDGDLGVANAAMWNESVDVPQDQIYVDLVDPISGAVVGQNVVAVIQEWFKQLQNAHTFQLWIKPAQPPANTGAPAKQVILAWESGPAGVAGVSAVAQPPDPAALQAQIQAIVHNDVYAQNYNNYYNAAFNDMPNYGNPYVDGVPEPTPPPLNPPAPAIPAAGNIQAPPPPAGIIPFLPHASYWQEVDVAVGSPAVMYFQQWQFDAAGAANDAAAYAQLLENYYVAQLLAAYLADLQNINFGNLAGQNVNYGTPGHLRIWLSPALPVNGIPAFTVNAEFKLDPQAYTNPPNQAFDCTWTYPTPIVAGTWHHIMWGFHSLDDANGDFANLPHANFVVDGANVQWAGNDPVNGWPQEVDPEARLVQQALLDVNAAIPGAIVFDPNNYLIPMELTPGHTAVTIGSGLTSSGFGNGFGFSDQGATFNGIVDNINFQGNYQQQNDPVVDRFDTWRPSLARVPTAADPALAYNKHTQAVEWQRPVIALSYDWTAWEDVPAGQGGYSDIGTLSLQVGWRGNAGNAPIYGAGAQAAQFTPALQGLPWLAMTNGYQIPDRNGALVNPFLTNPTEQYFYMATIQLSQNQVQAQDRNSPILDDVTVTYMPWDAAIVIEEVELD